jgi:hypothetical protein
VSLVAFDSDTDFVQELLFMESLELYSFSMSQDLTQCKGRLQA